MKKLFSLIFFLCCLKASSQTLFNVDADSLRFEYFVHLIESNSNYFFYFDTAQVNKLNVTIHAKTEPLENILDKIFANTELHYAIDDSNHVFVTGGFAIQTSLPKNFLNTQTVKTDTAFTPPQIELTGNSTTKEKIKIAVENKLFQIGAKTEDLQGK